MESRILDLLRDGVLVLRTRDQRESVELRGREDDSHGQDNAGCRGRLGGWMNYGPVGKTDTTT
jgi:hypothetical protein